MSSQYCFEVNDVTHCFNTIEEVKEKICDFILNYNAELENEDRYVEIYAVNFYKHEKFILLTLEMNSVKDDMPVCEKDVLTISCDNFPNSLINNLFNSLYNDLDTSNVKDPSLYEHKDFVFWIDDNIEL